MDLFPELRKALVATGSGSGRKWALPPIITDLNTNPYGSVFRSRRRNYDVNRAVIEVYERTVWAWKAIETIANHTGARQFRYRDRKTGTVIEDHPMYAVLNGSAANPLQTGIGFKRRTAAQLMLSDRGVFVEPTISNAGDVIRVDLLPPGRMEPIPSPGAELLERFELTMPTGEVRKITDIKSIRWIKNDHPLDPYRSSTPMNAIGLSVRMDDLGRVINVSWMSNDGNTRGILAVKGDLSDDHERKLETRFGVGPSDAGKVSVITGDGMEYVDLSAKPRDLQYEKLAGIAKIETLAGFGVPESQLGNASGRTYDNAQAEAYVFWVITMMPILAIIAAGFHDPDNPDLEPFFDVEDVEPLQIPLRAKLQQALAEVAAGVRTIESYAKLAGIELAESTAETRALWLPNQGRKALDQDPGADQRVKLAVEPDPAALAGAPGQGQAALEGGGSDPAAIGASAQPPAAAAAEPVPVAAPAAAADQTGGSKALDITAGPRYSDVDEKAQDAAEARVAATLLGLVDRWVDRTVSRLSSPKARKNTRHWTPDTTMPADLRVGSKTLDVMAAVDSDTWRTEAQQALENLLQVAADDAAVATIRDLTGSGPVDEHKVDISMLTLTSAVGASVGLVATAVGLAAQNAAARLAERLSKMEDEGSSIDEMAAAIRTIDLAGWARNLAETATGAAIESGRNAAVTVLGGMGWVIAGTWRTKHDDRVRGTHKAADGQVQPVGRPFSVGTALLRHPRDPLGPANEVLGCRCKVRWWVRRAAAIGAGR